MSNPGPFDDDDLPDGFDFEQLFGAGGDPTGFLSNLMAMFGGALGGGSGSMDHATQIAISIAAGGTPEPNVDPMDRMALEQLARVAELQIADATGLRTSASGSITIAPVNRSEWVRRSMQSYKPLLERLAQAMSSPALDDEELAGDPEVAALGQLFSALRPMMVSMSTGSMVGHLGSRALGTYDLPLPRPNTDELLVVVPNLDAFGEEWSLDRDELRMWIALSEVAYHAVLGIPHVAERITRLMTAHAEAFRTDPTALTDALGSIEPSADFGALQQQLQSVFGDPAALLGAMRSEEQERLLPELEALFAAIVGYVDHIMDSVGNNLITSYEMLTEALRRRRVTASDADRFVERLLGLELGQQLFDRGRSFVDGVVERAGEEGLARLWESERMLPTPNEIAAPGLWLERIALDLDEPGDSEPS